MHATHLLCGCLLALVGYTVPAAAQPDLPQPPREFRAAWVATVVNIDWPSKPGLPTKQQQAEFVRIVERAAELNLNALILQVRPAADAMYPSAFEPWSAYLTGTMGTPPTPPYDPLAFAVATAHQRGIELHAWFNPYRALHKTAQGPIAENHISKIMASAVKQYGGYLWLDPGNQQAAQHSLDVVLDVVRRYDIDGVHMDDYFYPYPVQDDQGQEIDFPDDDSFAQAQAQAQEKAAKPLDRHDWRRSNVDQLIHKLHHHVKRMKPWVRVGISPFGIWRPGHPESVQGFDAYDKLYADARKWLQAGWVDYLTPQLYWTIDSQEQSYPRLLDWWSQENTLSKHLWIGNYASRVGMEGERAWPAKEILDQINITRAAPGASGNVLFSMQALFDDYGDLGQQLVQGPYRQRALVPALPTAPAAAAPTLRRNGNQWTATMPNGNATWLWVRWLERDENWSAEIVPGSQKMVMAHDGRLAIAAVNRYGQVSAAVHGRPL